MATQFGATHTLNSKDIDNLEEAIFEINDGEGVEYAFKAIGLILLVLCFSDSNFEASCCCIFFSSSLIASYLPPGVW